MAEPLTPSTAEHVPPPLPRDPPPPPGYDDPLVASPVLDDLVSADPGEADDEPPGPAPERDAEDG
jgi:hypothetical protein